MSEVIAEVVTATLNVRAYEAWLYAQPGCQSIPRLNGRDGECRVVVLGANHSVCEALSGKWYRYVPNVFLRGQS